MHKLIIFTSIIGIATASPLVSTAQDVSTAISASATVGAKTSGKTYTVSTKGDRRDSAQDVFDEALYKAAKKTLRKDFEWFRIIDKETEKETERTRGERAGFETRYERVPVRSCGLLGCTTSSQSYRTTEFNSGTPDRKETTYSVDLEFEMGVGTPPNSKNVYNARIVKNSYK